VTAWPGAEKRANCLTSICTRSPGQGHSKRRTASRGARGRPRRRSARCTVECTSSTSEAINLGPQPVRRRSSQTRSWSAAGSSLGLRLGREERSSRHTSEVRSAGLAARQRPTQVWTVDLATFEAAAAASNVNPSSSTSLIMCSLPVGVRRALRCCIPGLRAVVSFDTHSLSAGPDLCQPVRNVLGRVS
jgi:hypothetical protein